MKSVKMKTNLALALLLGTVFYMESCSKEAGSGVNNNPVSTTTRSKISIHLTDDPSVVFDKVLLDIQKVELKFEDNGIDSLSGWHSVAIVPGVYDILQFRNGIDTIVAVGTIPAGVTLQKVRLTLGNNNSIVVAGVSKPLVVKDNDNQVEAKLDASNVELIGNDQIHFWIDFDAGHSIQVKSSNSGQNTSFELRSNIRIFSKAKSGEIEGRVLPAAAQALVVVTNGTDSASAKPEREGEFKVVGLKAGTYEVKFHATAGNYRDTVITGVVVRTNEDTKLPTITLKN
ncbi:MAG: DUF4382 domain-containing protein [Chitinophagaceae bacterium]|uniref:DUF4382 domain-containing protein n=1 Tax=unclassified Paraflavitalea TaxID=2798305 RepID=UPI003D346BB0|nr:DUF4382 domain-containing protein [Chitinophagaceae bacterium]